MTIISAPLSPIWFPSCSTRVTPSSSQPCVTICNSSHCSPIPPHPLHQQPNNNQYSRQKQSLTRWSSIRLLLTFSPSPIISAPLSPIWFPSCSTRVTPSSSQPCVTICNSSHCSPIPPHPLHQQPNNNQNSRQKQSLTRWRSRRLLLTFSPSPIISAPLSPIWFPS